MWKKIFHNNSHISIFSNFIFPYKKKEFFTKWWAEQHHFSPRAKEKATANLALIFSNNKKEIFKEKEHFLTRAIEKQVQIIYIFFPQKQEHLYP